jgi:hypothetical protein
MFCNFTHAEKVHFQNIKSQMFQAVYEKSTKSFTELKHILPNKE